MTYGVMRKGCYTVKRKAFHVLLVSSEPASVLSSLTVSPNPSFSIHLLIPMALNPCPSNCGPQMPAVLESPENLLEMQIPDLSLD